MPPKSDAERRSEPRYPVGFDLKYKVPSTNQVGIGKIQDMSSSGIFFACPEVLSVGTDVNLSIDWPILLNQVLPLQLRVSGWIVRNDQRGTAIRIRRHEFHVSAKAKASVNTQNRPLVNT